MPVTQLTLDSHPQLTQLIKGEIRQQIQISNYILTTILIAAGMSKSNNKISKNHAGLLNKYDQIHAKEYNMIEALFEMLDQKKSIKKIRIGLISIGKHEQNLQLTDWKQPQHKQQFIQICEELLHHFEQERDQSMRSTEKNLSQMNQQLSRMRKSLSQKGILLQFQNQQPQKKDSVNHNAENEDQRVDQDQSQSENQKQIKSNTNRSNSEVDQEDADKPQDEQNQQIKNEQKIEQYEEKEQQNEKLVRNQSQLDKSQKSLEWPLGEKAEDNEKNQPEMSGQAQKRSEVEKENKQNNHPLIENEEIVYHLENGRVEKNKPQIKLDFEHKAQNSHRDPVEWTEIPMPEKDKIKKISQKLDKSKQKKLYTLPEQLDNQFYDEEMQRSKVEKEQKKQKYNPHMEIMKKLNKNKKQQPEPKNELQGLYYSFKNKLIKLFAYYLKELKTKNFTFDEYPQSLDIKSFSAYYKYWKLAEICKVNQIPKLFKKYSINGAWLNENGFLQIHSRILDISDDPIQQINKIVEQRQKAISIIEANLKLIRQSSSSQEQIQLKEKEYAKKKEQASKKYQEFEDKLKRMNTLLSDPQIKKLTRKAQPKAYSVQQQNNSMNYDRERLRKIVQAHSGMNRDDILQKLNQRKREKQKRHEIQMHRIIQKYKEGDPNSKSNSASSFNKSSPPHIHKIQGYAKRNNIKRHSNQKKIDIEGPGLTQKQKFRSEPKIKPYFIATQSPETKISPKNQEIRTQVKAEIYKQLSLPKLPKRKMREQSIYQSLKNIDTKAEIEYIKKMLGYDKNQKSKQDSNKLNEDERILNQFYSKEKLILEKQKGKKASTLQNRMKFT